jgi:hypothetical protein
MQQARIMDARDVVVPYEQGNSVLGANDDVDMEEAQQKKRSGFETRGVLKDVDRDGDGFVTRDELEHYIGEHHVLNSKKKLFKIGFIIMVCLMFLFSFVVAGLTWGVIALTKEVTVEGDVMVSSDTGDALQCASTEIIVENGILMARHGNSSSHHRRLATDTNGNRLNDDTATALGVRNVYKKRAVSSTMPDKYFKELAWLEIISQSGSFLSLKILTIIRIPSANALCGTYLKLGTLDGTILLDEFDLYYDDVANDAFLKAGLIDYSTVSSPANRRHLSSIDHGSMRRLSGAGEFSLIGFFNAIDDADWTCKSVRKPSMPSEYSASFTLFNLCELGEDFPNQCQVHVPESPNPVPAYGLVTVDGEEYYSRLRKAYVTAEYSALVDTYPHYPGMTFVTKSYPSGLAHVYQFDGEGTLCQCQEFQNMNLRMTLPTEYLLYPLGDVGDNLFRYRLSYMGLKGHISDGNQWIHIDYFEDNTTLLPKSLIADDNILQVDSMLTGDSMEYFSSSGFDISDTAFSWCAIATKVAESGRSKTYADGETLITANSTLSEKLQYEDEEASWDWVSTPYPPVYASPASLGSNHLYYFADIYTSYNETADLYTGHDEFGEWVATILNNKPEVILSDGSTPEHLNPNGTFYVPYSLDVGGNLSFPNISYFNFTNTTNMTWINDTEIPLARSRALQETYPRSQQRQLGPRFSVAPLVPSIDIDIEKYRISYRLGSDDGHWTHYIAFRGEGCFKMICVIGEIHAAIRDGSADKNDYGGYVKVKVDVKAISVEAIVIRYDYFGGEIEYDGYLLSGGTHIASVERTETVGSQIRATAGTEFSMSKRKISKNGRAKLYNAGKVKFYARAQAFVGIGIFNIGRWITLGSYTYPIHEWGTTDTVALVNCDGSVSVDMPTGFLPPNWSLGVADVYANMASNGRFYIKLNKEGGKEHLWYTDTYSPSNKNLAAFFTFSYNGAAIMFFGIQGPDIGVHVIANLDVSMGASCDRISSTMRCLDENSNIINSDITPLSSFQKPVQMRWRLYGDGNLKAEYSIVKQRSNFYQLAWRIAWESGVRGSCALKIGAE